MIYGSVCSGIEAATAAWHPLGWRPAWFCEIEPFPCAVLAHHHPQVPNYGDFTTLLQEGHPRAGVDVLVGGTPCQAFSVAGLRGGLADPRGNLALAFVALAGALRPRWVVWENVPGVLSIDGGRAFGSILGGLAELGYGWAYRVLDAQYFGLAQRRKRVFVVGCLGSWQRAAAVLFEPESVRRDHPPRRKTGAGVAGSVGTGASDGGGWRVGADEAAAGHIVPARNGNVDGIAHTLKAKHNSDHRADSETYIPVAYDERIGRECSPNVHSVLGATEVAHALRADGHDASEDGTGRGSPLAIVGVQEDKQNGVTVRDTAGSLRSNAPGSQVGGTLALAFDARQSDVIPYGDLTGPLDTDPGTIGVHARRGVRRLMPHEMERLQGFPEDYTLIPGQAARAVEDDYAAWFAARYPEATRAEIERFAKDGPRAKALGNSMAVPCMAWIGKRIVRANLPTDHRDQLAAK